MTSDSQEELLTEVDADNNIIGPITRGLAHQSPDKYYRCIAVLVFDSDKRLLIQKRSPTKDLYPNCWDISVGGHVEYGNSYLDTAIRELSEELGITATSKDMIDMGEILVTLPESHEYFHAYEYYLQPHDQVCASQSEVDSTKWLNINEVKASMQQRSHLWYGRPIQIINTVYK